MPLLTVMSLTNMSPCSSRLSRVSLFSGSLFQLQTRARSPQPAQKTWNSLLPREGCGFTCSPWLHPWVSVPGANHLAGTRRGWPYRCHSNGESRSFFLSLSEPLSLPGAQETKSPTPASCSARPFQDWKPVGSDLVRETSRSQAPDPCYWKASI